MNHFTIEKEIHKLQIIPRVAKCLTLKITILNSSSCYLFQRDSNLLTNPHDW